MDPHQPNDPRQLKLSNQIRFLIYLYWLRFQEQGQRFLIGLFFSPRARVHWIGTRRRRLERTSIVLLFLLAMLLLEPREYAVWAAIFGGFTAMVFPLLFFHYRLMRVLGADEQ